MRLSLTCPALVFFLLVGFSSSFASLERVPSFAQERLSHWKEMDYENERDVRERKLGERDAEGDCGGWLSCAVETSSYSASNLRIQSGNYPNSTANKDWTFCWDNFSQIAAHVFTAFSLAKEGNITGAAELLALAEGILEWQNQSLWKPTAPGGFYAAALSNTPSSYVARNIQYTDDNAFAGTVFLQAYFLLSSPVLSSINNGQFIPLKDKCFQGAEDTAAWLMSNISGAWDRRSMPNGGGGGFWWNVSIHGPTEYSFRPLNSNGLALQLFSSLFKVTGKLPYLYWAQRVNEWLKKNLYDEDTGDFNWFVDYNGNIDNSKFAYDNGIAAEAYAILGDAISDQDLIDFAGNVAATVDQLFWNEGSGAYTESTLVWWAVSTTLSGWLSKSVLAVLSFKPSPTAVNMSTLHSHACQNVEFINQYLRGPGGLYYDSVFLDGTGAVTDYISTLNCAWGQWLTSSVLPFCHGVNT